MRVSELAKELGYKAAELVALAQARKIKIVDTKTNVNARMAAMVRAQVPHRSKLSGALRDVYNKVVDEENRKAAERAAAPRKARPKRDPSAPKKPRAPRKPAAEKKPAPKKPAAAKPAPPPKPAKKTKVVQEFRLSDAQKAEPTKLDPHRKVGFTKEEKAAIKRETTAPLIDVDKVIGAQREMHAQRPIEIEVYQRDKEVPQSKDRRMLRSSARPVQPVAPPPKRPIMNRYSGPPRGRDMRRGRPRPGSGRSRPPGVPAGPRPNIPTLAERKIEVTVPISIKNFCEQTGIKVNSVIRKLMDQGIIATINHTLDEEMVIVLAGEFKRDISVVKQKSAEEQIEAVAATEDDPKDLIPRAPVVTFMGHVDHGKTSLLDKIRNTNVVAGESGGITQHIGASKVKTPDGKTIVFLDTPGHEAFTQMRSRGARVTDLAVIVVAADDGVMPQTEEAINHAKAANVKILVALNKVDKPGSNPNRVKGQLAALELAPEDWGGQTTCVEVSALTGQNVDQLLEMLTLEAEMLELKANPKRDATGVVLEARKTEDRGVVATLLVQNGTLKKGDFVLAGPGYGRVRAMTGHDGKPLVKAGPSTPVELLGLAEVPDAGDTFQVVRDPKKAKEAASDRERRARERALQERQHVSLENIYKSIEAGQLREVRIVLKTDVKGSLEVLRERLPALSTDEVKLQVLHSGLGAVTEGDILLADASDAIVIGFHVDVESRAAEMAKDRKIDIRRYTVIYEALDEMKAALEGLLEPEVVEVRQGLVGVKEIFRISRVGTIAGCMVTEGKIERSNTIRLLRDGKVVHTGKLESLKRFKDDVKEVASGYECGVKLAGHDDVRKGDVIEAIATKKIARKLEKKQ